MHQIEVSTKFSAKRAKDEKDHFAKRTITVPDNLSQDELSKWEPIAKKEAADKGIEVSGLEALIAGVVAPHRLDLNRRLDEKYGKRDSAAANTVDAETL